MAGLIPALPPLPRCKGIRDVFDIYTIIFLALAEWARRRTLHKDDKP